MWEFHKYFKIVFWVSLFILHFIFTLFSISTFSDIGGDASTYWGQFSGFNPESWCANFGVSTSFIVFLNYPLIISGFSIEVGFWLYSLIGLLGFYFFICWINGLNTAYRFSPLAWFGVAIAIASPNLHFWTSMLGKEPIMFLFLSLFAWSSINFKSRKIALMIALLGIFTIRPHLFLMLGLTAGTFMIIYYKTIPWNRYWVILGSLFVFLATYFTFHLTKIRTLNWERIKRYNAFSVDSFKDSNTYVPMPEMNYLEKIFSFLFRPLFAFDTFESTIVSFENIILLLTVVFSFSLIIIKKLVCKLPKQTVFIILFTLICTLFYIERYANFGIFMRTKIQFVPFLIIGLALAISINPNKETNAIRSIE